MTGTPLSSTTVADHAAAVAHIAEHVSGASRVLTETTAVLDSSMHQLVIDPETRTVWWAYDNAPLDTDGWTVEQLTSEAATEQLSDHIELIQDRMADAARPDSAYAMDFADLDRDQDVLDEYTEIMRLALPAEPQQMAQRIRRQRELLTRQDALWQRAYANLVRELVGPDRGGKSRAAGPLGVTDVQVGRIIREDDQRRAALAATVHEASDLHSRR
ncbi:hypothetical protein SAZ11_08750 [Streptomyces sp. FXJ1.4098]|nr:hypothetical protein [Streptomyces sp. FXJ1.4098]